MPFQNAAAQDHFRAGLARLDAVPGPRSGPRETLARFATADGGELELATCPGAIVIAGHELRLDQAYLLQRRLADAIGRAEELVADVDFHGRWLAQVGK